mmetsp:Transcript_3488/g.5386  ORF Transcript_3488/g.5386 Transcript_3488/m.5386 type:complete len:209 (+) Transcript_3488:1655-2281(+)
MFFVGSGSVVHRLEDFFLFRLLSPPNLRHQLLYTPWKLGITLSIVQHDELCMTIFQFLFRTTSAQAFRRTEFLQLFLLKVVVTVGFFAFSCWWGSRWRWWIWYGCIGWCSTFQPCSFGTCSSTFPFCSFDTITPTSIPSLLPFPPLQLLQPQQTPPQTPPQVPIPPNTPLQAPVRHNTTFILPTPFIPHIHSTRGTFRLSFHTFNTSP